MVLWKSICLGKAMKRILLLSLLFFCLKSHNTHANPAISMLMMVVGAGGLGGNLVHAWVAYQQKNDLFCDPGYELYNVTAGVDIAMCRNVETHNVLRPTSRQDALRHHLEWAVYCGSIVLLGSLNLHADLMKFRPHGQEAPV